MRALPAFKETVEELFVRGLVRAVFATETLALGINMPARTVVLERLTKFNGETHADLTAGEYTQLTGRAGRRGIDVEGHAVVVWAPERRPGPRRRAGVDPHLSAALLVSARPTTWRSTWSTSWAASRRAELSESSFAQFQADRGVGGLGRADRRRTRTTLRDYTARMHCDLGDFAEYAGLRRQLSQREIGVGAAGCEASARRGRCVAGGTAAEGT